MVSPLGRRRAAGILGGGDRKSHDQPVVPAQRTAA
jgi:hypothetical protein